MKLSEYLVPFESLSGANTNILIFGQLILFFVIWMLLPDTTLPTPGEILTAWDDMARNQAMLSELFKSAKTIWISIFWSTLIAGTITALSTANFFKPSAKALTSLRFLGFAGITFFFTLWTSSGAELKIWMLTFGMTVFLLTNMLSMAAGITQDEIDYARTLRLNGWQITWEVVLRGKMDEALDLIRQNAAMGWTLLSMVEGLVRSEGGIGTLLLNQNKYLHLSAIFAIQLTILTYGLLQDKLLHWIRFQLCPYLKYSEQK